MSSFINYWLLAHQIFGSSSVRFGSPSYSKDFPLRCFNIMYYDRKKNIFMKLFSSNFKQLVFLFDYLIVFP